MKKRYKAKTDLYVGYEYYLGNDIKWSWGEKEKTPLFRKDDIVEVDFDELILTKIREDYTEEHVDNSNDGFINLSKNDNQKRYQGFARLYIEELEDFFEEVK